MLITSTTIIQMCSKLAALSSNQAGLGSTDFLNLSNLVMTVLTSELLAAREEYLIYTENIAVTANTTAVRIPYRAVNSTVRHVWWEDSAGARTRLELQAIEDLENTTAAASGTPQGCYLMGNSIMLLPKPNADGSLFVAYPFRPSQLVDATRTAAITAVGASSVTVANVPSNFGSGLRYDIVDHTSGNGILKFDQVGTIVGTTITLPSVSGVAVGDYICLTNESPIPMIPEEGHSLLLETVVLRLEMMRGNAARIKNSSAVVADARKAWDALLLNRLVSKPHPAGSGGQQFPLRPL